MFPSVQLKKTTFLRLSKILSLSSITSRTKAQEFIKNGKVKVDSQIINKNVFVDVNSTIEVNGAKIDVDIRTKLWGIYKPKNVFCNTDKNYEYQEKHILHKNVLNRDYSHFINYEDENLRKHLIAEDVANTPFSRCGKIKNDNKCYDQNLSTKSKSLIVSEAKIGQSSYTKILKKTDKRELKANNVSTSSSSKLNMNIFDFIKKKNIIYEEKNKIMNFIPDHLITINSLDSLSEGLVLFTNDGEFAKNLKNINNNILTTYLIKVQGELCNEKLKLLKKGSYIGHVHISILNIEIIKSKYNNKWIKLTYVENSKSDLDFLFSKYNLVIRKCKRFSFGTYKSSELSENFFMPLKIHSTINHLIPNYRSKLVLTHPKGNITTDVNRDCLYVKDYLQVSLIKSEPKH